MPAIWSLEKSIDHGETWSVWQYFVKDSDNCELLHSYRATDKKKTGVAAICSSQSYIENSPIFIYLIKNQKFTIDDPNWEVVEEWIRVSTMIQSILVDINANTIPKAFAAANVNLDLDKNNGNQILWTSHSSVNVSKTITMKFPAKCNKKRQIFRHLFQHAIVMVIQIVAFTIKV